jgi:hypothetical protein
MTRGLWIVLLIATIKIISLIVQHQKKEQERKAREEALRQRALAESGGVPPTPPTPTATTAPVQTAASVGRQPGGGEAAVHMEARRREQLEQLRQRRENRRGGVPVVQAKLPTAPPLARRGLPLPTQPITRPPSGAGATIFTSDQARVRAQEQARRARDTERQQRAQQARAAAALQEAEDVASHRAYEKDFHTVAGEEDAASHGVTPTRPAVAVALGRLGAADRAGVTAAGLLSRLREPATLREVIMLREIVDKPIALRDM